MSLDSESIVRDWNFVPDMTQFIIFPLPKTYLTGLLLYYSANMQFGPKASSSMFMVPILTLSMLHLWIHWENIYICSLKNSETYTSLNFEAVLIYFYDFVVCSTNLIIVTGALGGFLEQYNVGQKIEKMQHSSVCLSPRRRIRCVV